MDSVHWVHTSLYVTWFVCIRYIYVCIMDCVLYVYLRMHYGLCGLSRYIYVCFMHCVL